MSAETWVEDNNRYLAASLKWLRMRLQQLAPAPAAAPAPMAVVPVAAAAPAATGPRSWFPPRTPAAAAAAAAGVEPVALLSGQSQADVLKQAAEDRETAAASDPPPALVLLAQRFRLTAFERDTLLLCAAPEFDPALAPLLAAAQGHPSRSAPTFALALQAFEALDERAWDALSPQRPLRYARLLEITQAGATPLTASALRADERIVNYLKGLNVLDERLAALMKPASGPPPVLAASQQATADEILRRLGITASESTVPLVQLLGPDARSKFAVARQVCSALDRQLFRLNADALPTQRAELETLARLWQRECVLLPVALYIDAEQIDGGRSEPALAFETFVGRELGLGFAGRREAPTRAAAASLEIEVDKPTGVEQHDAWREALHGTLADDEAEATARLLAGQFDLDLDEIRVTAAQAATPAPGVSPAATVWASCRALAQPSLDQLAQRIEPKATWDELVLSDESLRLLRQIAAQVRERYRVYEEWGYGRRMTRGLGINALFAGESGTGKTMAAEVIANELQLHLYRIDLSAVVSKYIGETEKNLRKLFDAAEQGGAILFFDEADALFGKRSEVKDSHDRYANIEINYLLQRMEAFSGLAILATNMKSALDPAFMRRLRFIVNFPFPGPTERRQMWQKALPPEVPQEDVDTARLARFNVSGGNIHSIALNAAFMAAQRGSAVSQAMLLAAVRNELRKLDKPVNEAEFR
ncbi:ATP-binding protein [Ramlibacter sp. G-1-2-2]|uniref:ATP-binding protein n=1 Tax=Ramlibacter agri TaxID=2728837 RepID=A0A848H7S5_9BURK|nr:ATP-binding protein [Ramlibacter agri]NML46845.1 ATP-binding protein [Ramlibacter agri]